MSFKFNVRHFALINLLPTYPKWKGVIRLQPLLEDSIGESVTTRTIQRDLEKLSGYGITRFTDSPDGYKWSLDENALHVFAQLSPADALCFVIIKKVASPLLPNIISPYLNRIFDRAELTLQQLKSTSQLKTWVDKVYLEFRGQPLIAAPIDNDVKNTVYEGLLKEELLIATYQKKSGEKKNITIKPLGLVLRSHIQYVVVEYKDIPQEYRLLVLNRFISCKNSGEKFKYPDYFNLGDYVVSGNTGFSFENDEVYFEAIFKDFAETLVCETPINSKQKVTKFETGVKLIAKVKLNYDFESWLMSLGEHVKIIEPKNLAKHIKKRLENAFLQYK